MDETSAPKKKKSGAQHRKERAAREAAAKRAPSRALVPSNSWGSLEQYASASAAWDPNGPPVELPLYGQPPTTFVKAIAGTIAQLETGAFYQSAYLWDGMTRDDRVAATLGQRIDRLIGSPVDLEPADLGDEQEGTKEDDEEDSQEQQVADAAKRDLFKMIPPHQQYQLMRWGLGLSVGIAQVLTTRSPKGNLPTFEVWNPRNLRFDWMIRKFCLVTENRGEIVLDEDDPEWIIYQPYGHKGWLSSALIRSIVQPWLIRYWVRTWWARFQEVHGQPLRLGELPPSRDPKDEAQFLSELTKIGHEAVIRLPVGTDGNKFDVRLLESTSGNWEGFQKLLEHCDDSISIAILGQRQSTMGQGGLKADANAGESTLSRLSRKDALIGDLLRERILKPWAADNFSNEELAPYICWQFDPPEDEGQAATSDLAVAQALVAFSTAKAPLDVREYLEERGYPLLTPAMEKQMKEEAQKQEQVKADQAHANALEITQAKGQQPPAGAPGNEKAGS